MDSLSMVQRSGNQLIVRSVVSGDQLYSGGRHAAHQSGRHQTGSKANIYEASAYVDPNNDGIEEIIDGEQSSPNKSVDDDSNLPQCKIKRNYSCNNCNYFTQNPRHFLAHLRDVHGEKIIINECKHCLYASRHYQKLVRHMKMVHGSTDGLEEQAQSRKRASQQAREEKKRRQHMASISGPVTAVAVAAAAAAALPQLSALNVANLTMNSVQAQQSMMVQAKAITPTASTSAPQPVVLDAAANAEMLNQKFLKCTLCDYTTLYRTQMVEHEREQHNRTKFFRCSKCSYVTHIKSRYSKHVKYHSMPMIKCVMCDFRTPYKWNLDRHMKNHGGAGPFKCSACNFTADIKQSLTVHEMNHHVPPVGHATGMHMARRRNKVGGTDLVDADYGMMGYGDNSDGAEAMDANNSDDNYDNSGEEDARREQYENDMIEQEDEYQMLPADLSQKMATPAKKPARPLPNLIPIQPIMNASDAVNLSVRNRSLESLLKGEQSELRVNPQSCLKDLASVFVSDEMIDISETSQMSPVSNASSAKPKSSFFAELKEKGAIECANLACECGHSAKCLSEAMRHKRMCTKRMDKNQNASALSLIINNMGTSTRCQYCRHRCKTSADLFLHMQKCAEARSSAESCDSASEIESSHNDKVDVSGDLTDEGMIDLTAEPHPMENKVFVWNTLPQPMPLNAKQPEQKQFDGMQRDELIAAQVNEDNENNDDEKADENSYFGIETAPGYGEVTQKMNPDDEALHTSLKKVFKCPHCSFWASTASRFHVHIVGHLNKKPFECSLCSYRSNWRWDITKHIRLKTLRDASHKSAKVLMNDETGRRNYTKYNKYITLMKVTGEDGDPKQMKSGEMTPNQEAAAKQRRYDTVHDHSNDHMDEEKSLALAHNALFLSLTSNSGQFNMDNDKDKQGDSDSIGKRTSYKCKKCNFRDPNRLIVLEHVKGHYKEANIPIDEPSGHSGAGTNAAAVTVSAMTANEFNNNVYNGLLSALTANNNKLLLQQQQLGQAKNDQTLPQIHMQTLKQLSGNPSIFLDLKQQQHQQVQPLTISSITQNASNQSLQTANTIPNMNNSITSSTTTTTTTSTTANSTTNENGGEMDEASSGLSSVNGWRGTAPYRCGHCHQVSNWKHVIQRHCRLKHDGDIQIEIKVKGSNDQYQPLNMQNGQPTTSTPITSMSTVIAAPDPFVMPTTSSGVNNKEQQSLSFLTKLHPIKLPVTNESMKPSTSDAIPKENMPSLNLNDINLQSLDADQKNLLLNLLAKQQILFNGNLLTLIKPTDIVRCSSCNFEAPNENILNQHIQLAHLNSESSIIDLITGTASQSHAANGDQSIDLDEAIATNRLPNNKRPVNDNEDGANRAKKGKSDQCATIDRQSERVGRDEKCPHCPFVTNKSDVLKEHMSGHFSVSGHRNAIACNFCDFSSTNDDQATEHNHIHFGLIKGKQKPVAFYTSYDNLEITTIDQQNNNNSNQNGNNNNDSGHQNPYANSKTLYPKMGFDLHSSSDKENKILVDIDTGHIVK